jgi:hypothetical protein
MDHFKIFYSSEHVVKMLFWGVDNAAPYQSNSHWNIPFRGLMQKYPILMTASKPMENTQPKQVEIGSAEHVPLYHL